MKKFVIRALICLSIAFGSVGFLFAQEDFIKNGTNYTKWRLNGFIGADMAALSDGWNIDMGLGCMAGLYLTPQKIWKIENSMASLYQAQMLMMGLPYPEANPLDVVTQAYYEQGKRFSFGIQSGYTIAGDFEDPVGQSNVGPGDRILSTIEYVPVLGSVQHIFWVSRPYRHLFSEVLDHRDTLAYRSGNEARTMTFSYSTSDLYMGYRLSAGPAFILDSDYGDFEEIPFNARVELLFGGLERRSSWINCSLFYDMMFLNDSSINKDYLGRLGLNWSFSFHGRGY